MKKNTEFVPYNESLKLRHLGFNMQPFGFWMVSERTKGKPKLYQTIRKINSECVRTDTCSAPMFFQVHKWLRETHNLEIVIQSRLIGGVIRWKSVIKTTNPQEIQNGSFEDYPSFEIAELTSIQFILNKL